MKKRKGFGLIVIDGEQFQYTWSSNVSLILYDVNDKKITIPYETWGLVPNSEKYIKKDVWHGKNKNGPDFGGWGKPQAAEMYRKWKTVETRDDKII